MDRGGVALEERFEPIDGFGGEGGHVERLGGDGLAADTGEDEEGLDDAVEPARGGGRLAEVVPHGRLLGFSEHHGRELEPAVERAERILEIVGDCVGERIELLEELLSGDERRVLGRGRLWRR